MRKFFFLQSEISYPLLILFIYGVINFQLGYKIIVAVFCLSFFYAFRRASIPYRDTLKNNGEIYLSPVHGEVQAIRRNVTVIDDVPMHEVRIKIGGWDEKGLYLPTAGEVSYLKAFPGEKISREADDHTFDRPISELAHTQLTLTSKNQTKTILRFIDCVYGVRPAIWLKSGDRGRGAACFGYYPFGGTLIIYLPVNSDILVFENERIVPGQTVVAALKDVK